MSERLLLGVMGKCGQQRVEAATSARLDALFEAVREPRFEPAGWRGNAHFQTIWPNRIQRDPAGPELARGSTREVIESEDGDKLQLFWSRHEPDDDRPVLIVLHGLTGCADAENVMATAKKGFDAGFDIVRVDLRNSQSDMPSTGVGHAGRSEDLRAAVLHVRERRPGTDITVIGFSMGGNIVLKAAGEYGDAPPPELRAVATISVPLDLSDACTKIDGRRSNWIYRNYFLRRLGQRYLRARELHPHLFHHVDVDRIRGIREWDNAIVAPLGGFENAEDYYAKNSSLKVLHRIRLPALLVHAKDDPFIPIDPFLLPAVRDNDWLRVLAPPNGGHVGFYADSTTNGEPDRYWAENRALAFCAAAVGLR